jgi:hypothetical protein
MFDGIGSGTGSVIGDVLVGVSFTLFMAGAIWWLTHR